MIEPTEGQKEAFWRRHGFHQVTRKEVYDLGYYTLWENGKGYIEGKLPDIDLNNLFKWAVPRLEELQSITFNWHRNNECEVILWFYSGIKVAGIASAPNLALFWAIWELIGGEFC